MVLKEDYFVDMAVFLKNIVHTRGVPIPRGHCRRRPICIYYFLGSTGMQRCRLSVDPRGTAVTFIWNHPFDLEFFDFPIVNLIRIRSKEPAPLFENNIDIYRERFPRIQ